MYLMKYGYMDGPGHGAKSAPLLSQDGLREYIREFQVCHCHKTNYSTDQETIDPTKPNSVNVANKKPT